MKIITINFQNETTKTDSLITFIFQSISLISDNKKAKPIVKNTIRKCVTDSRAGH